MQFSTKEDIEAPIDDVFARLSDFEVFERSAIRRGVEVQRADQVTRTGVGMAWDATFLLRGKQRRLHLHLARFDRPTAMRIDGQAHGIDSRLEIDLLALSPRRTRMTVVLGLTPKTFTARLFVQSLKLTKKNLNRRFRLKVADFAKDIEDRSGRPA